MILINDPQDAPSGSKVVAVGSFDGLHLGHQALLSEAFSEAKMLGLPLLVYTFDPPTKVFIKGEGFLTSLSEKVDLLQKLGTEITLVVPFNETFAARDKSEFLQDLRDLEAQLLYVGDDFRFGKARAGGPEDLEEVAPVHIVPLLEWQGEAVKSSRIREVLRQGDVELARNLLGRPYAAKGVVVEGDKRGRTIGFPTANLAVSSAKILPNGVFAVTVEAPSGLYKGMANVGHRPTVQGLELRLEVHLFDFFGHLYGEELEVFFRYKLRDEQRFESLGALQSQLLQDAETAKAVLQDSV